MYNHNVVYCIFLRSVTAVLVELEKAMFIVATLVLIITIITPGPYFPSKQSKTSHAKCNLNVIFEKKCL